MSNSFKPPERVFNALDNKKLNLFTPCPGAPEKTSALIWGITKDNNPRITVYTNDPTDTGADKGYGKIDAKLDMPVFFAFLQLLNNITNHSGEIKEKIENTNYTFPNGKRSEKPTVVSELWVGKEKDGVVWMSVTANNRPRIKFNFAPSSFHRFMHADGTPFTPGETSKLFALGHISILEKMMVHVAVNTYVKPEPKNQQGGNNWSNNNRSNNGGNSGSSNIDSQDLPF